MNEKLEVNISTNKKSHMWGFILGITGSLLGSFLYSFFSICFFNIQETVTSNSQIRFYIFLPFFLYCLIISFIPCGFSGVAIQIITQREPDYKKKNIYSIVLGSTTGLFCVLIDNMLILERLINLSSFLKMIVLLLIGAVFGFAIEKLLNSSTR